MNSKVLLLVSLILSLVSCVNNTKNASENKASTKEEVDAYSMTAVMAVHDEVMPKMGEISLLIEKLKPLADQNPDSPYANAMKELQNSHKAMMDWMGDIGEAFTSDEILKGAPLSADKKARLKVEAERIAAVKDLMLRSIDEGKRLLDAANAE
jgi:hypothetical protein